VAWPARPGAGQAVRLQLSADFRVGFRQVIVWAALALPPALVTVSVALWVPAWLG
jgi:hypothetical protein